MNTLINQSIKDNWDQRQVLDCTPEELQENLCFIKPHGTPVLKVKENLRDAPYYWCQECVDKQDICKGDHDFHFLNTAGYSAIPKVDFYKCSKCEAILAENYNPDRSQVA